MGKFNYKEAPENDPIRIEQVFAEKPGGGVVHVTEDMPATTPVSANEDGTFEFCEEVQKLIRPRTVVPSIGTNKVYCELDFYEAFQSALLGTSRVVINGSNFDVYSDKVTKDDDKTCIELPSKVSIDANEEFILETTNDSWDYAKEIRIEKTIIGTPVYITGNDLKADDGEYQAVRLINGANVRKETAIITEEQAEKMTGIHLV